jgi:hypothetical protein
MLTFKKICPFSAQESQINEELLLKSWKSYTTKYAINRVVIRIVLNIVVSHQCNDAITKERSMKIVYSVVSVFIIAIYFIYSIYNDTETIRNDVTIHIKDPNVAPQAIKIAVIGDIHLPEGSHHLEKFRDILIEIKNAKPDLVIFLGDYIQNHKKLENFSAHRKNIIKSIKLIEPLPIAVVLGNHETYSNVNTWIG